MDTTEKLLSMASLVTGVLFGLTGVWFSLQQRKDARLARAAEEQSASQVPRVSTPAQEPIPSRIAVSPQPAQAEAPTPPNVFQASRVPTRAENIWDGFKTILFGTIALILLAVWVGYPLFLFFAVAERGLHQRGQIEAAFMIVSSGSALIYGPYAIWTIIRDFFKRGADGIFWGPLIILAGMTLATLTLILGLYSFDLISKESASWFFGWNKGVNP